MEQSGPLKHLSIEASVCVSPQSVEILLTHLQALQGLIPKGARPLVPHQRRQWWGRGGVAIGASYGQNKISVRLKG